MFREPAAPLSGGHWLTGTEPVRGIGSWLRAGFEPTDGARSSDWVVVTLPIGSMYGIFTNI